MRDTGVLKLPGESTLWDYTNYIQPKTGFQAEAVNEIQDAAEKLSESQRYVVLLHEEMSLKEDLVFDSKTGELVRFANIRKQEESGDSKAIASHVLVFYVVGLKRATSSPAWAFLEPAQQQPMNSILSSGKLLVFWNRHATWRSSPQPVTRHHPTNACISFMATLMKSKTVNLYAPDTDRQIFFLFRHATSDKNNT